MTEVLPEHVPPSASARDDIRPFHSTFGDAELSDLQTRIKATRWPDCETVSDASQGPPIATMQKVAEYWTTKYDWRKCEAKLNALPQFITTIDDLDIHFIHVRSTHANALPLIVTHGWPGSIIAQIKIIEPLTNPTAHGATADDAFHLVIPSIPGYGFSGKPTTTGWTPQRIAAAWLTLMKRLGYTRFVAQGGDWGAIITEVMGTQAPPELLGIHTNFPGTVPPEISRPLAANASPPAGLSVDEERAFFQLGQFFIRHAAFAAEMRARPQTLYEIADSPIGLAAWMLDHDPKSYTLIAGAFDDAPSGLSRDDVLDNITLTWLTNTAISSARLYWENRLPLLDAKHVTIPVAVSVFPDEIYQAPRSWTERAFPKLIYFNQLDRGGHYAAWEQPELLVSELRAGLKSLRT